LVSTPVLLALRSQRFQPALAFVNTVLAQRPAATLSWIASVKALMPSGKASMLGAASGAVAGLVAVTPAAGFVGIDAAPSCSA
jgi:Amt family ammonium transporter